MKKITLFVFMLLPVISAVGQTQNIDSLVNVLNGQKLDIKKQLDLYLKICHGFYASYNSTENIFYAQKGLLLAEKENDKFMMSKFNEYIGYGYSDKSVYDTAMVYYEKALDLAIRIKDTKQELGMYITISALYANTSKYTQALEYSLRAIPLSEELNDIQREMTILSNIGRIYAILNNSDQAIHYFEKVIAVAEASDDNDRKKNVYYELGKIYKDRKEYGRALDYAQKTFDISRSTNDRAHEAMSLQLMSEIYYRNDTINYDKALQYAEESVRICEKLGHKGLLIASWNILSNVYREKKQYAESERIANKAWELDSVNLSINMDYVATNILYNISYSNIFLGNKSKAANFLKKYRSTMSEYNDRSLHQAFTEMEVKYEVDKKEMRIDALEKERQLYIWLGIAGVLFVVALLVVLWQTVRSARKEKLLIATRSVLDGEMRERARLAQDLHDRLSGNLSAVKIELGSQADSMPNVQDKLDNCIRDIRNAAHDLMPSSLQFGMKVALEDFAAQFPNVRFHFFGEEKRIDRRIEFVVYCCASELVNNAVKHSGAENIDLQLVQDERHVTLTVSDNGCGYDEKAAVRGFGLKSIRDRVASCNGKMDTIISRGEGTETTIEMKTNNA